MGKKLEEPFQILDFDSKLFGYKVAKINASNLELSDLERTLSKLSNENVRLVYWFIDPKDEVSNKAAKENNGFLADEKVTYVKTIFPSSKYNIYSENIKSYLYKPMNKQLLSLSLQSGVYSRFKIDPHFINNEFETLYTEWLRKSLSGILAKQVLVYVKEGEVGFITIGKKNGCGAIGLFAVGAQFRGRSIGRQLVEAAFIEAAKLGCGKMQVVTQKENDTVCKLYEKLGFTVDRIVNVYHFWLNG